MRAEAQAPDNPFLTRQARKGDLEALEALYRAHAPRVLRIARRLCRRPEDAEEVVQETFMEMVRSIGGYRGEGAVGHWLGRIAASKALDRLRLLAVRAGETSLEEEREPQSVLAFAPSPGGVPARMDLETALSRLPDLSRMVVWLHDVEGYTHDEIAQITGKTASFSKSQLSRAHERLRQVLAEEGEGEACTRA